MADAFVISSVSETQGLVTVEALACDLPVVARDDAANLDIIDHGKYGLVFSSADELPSAVDRLLSNPDLQNNLRSRAREGSLRYRDEAYGKAVGEFYSWVLQDYRSKQGI